MATARLAFGPDSSFLRQIAIGAVGIRGVFDDLACHGHRVQELELASNDTKLWKDAEGQRVRMPDLVCRRCGLRIESRPMARPKQPDVVFLEISW